MTQSCPTLCNPMDCSRPGSSIHGIFQARILEWVAVAFSKVSSQPRDWAPVSCIAGRLFFIIWATEESICQNPYINIMFPLRISFTYFILLHIHYHTKNRGWTLSCLENIYLVARPVLNYSSLFHFDFFYRTVQPHLHGHLALEAKILMQLSQR